MVLGDLIFRSLWGSGKPGTVPVAGGKSGRRLLVMLKPVVEQVSSILCGDIMVPNRV